MEKVVNTRGGAVLVLAEIFFFPRGSLQGGNSFSRGLYRGTVNLVKKPWQVHPPTLELGLVV
jgi:hypothetical protein